MIRLGTLFSGIGAIEQALLRMNLKHSLVFACDNGELELKLLPRNEQNESEKKKRRRISQKKKAADYMFLDKKKKKLFLK